MSERDELADLIESGYAVSDTDCPYDHAPEIADAILADGWRPPARTITTVEELDALPVGSMVLDTDPDALLKIHGGTFRSLTDPTEPFKSIYISLPATVLYEPEADL